MSRPTVSELLKEPEAVLYRGDLAKLGYERRAIDAIFKICATDLDGVEEWAGYSRPTITVRAFLQARQRHTRRYPKAQPRAGV